MRYLVSLILISYASLAMAQKHLPAYQLYNSKGKKVSYQKMLSSVQDSDMLFFGELHNNPISHWLQLQITQDLYSQLGDELVLGAEMFEADNQLLINEYFLGLISTKNFEDETRLWPNYATDYKPLLEFARKNGLKFVATNVPRRYASVVFKEGLSSLDQLSANAQIYMAPLPIETDFEVDCYKKMLEMGGGNVKFPHAQMIKDATMAHFMLQNWVKGEFFLHYNGSFHSDYHEGIVWYIKQTRPELRISVITTVEQNDISKLSPEHEEKADFIICIPANMTKTY